jgi:hypothetical protein
MLEVDILFQASSLNEDDAVWPPLLLFNIILLDWNDISLGALHTSLQRVIPAK